MFYILHALTQFRFMKKCKINFLIGFVLASSAHKFSVA